VTRDLFPVQRDDKRVRGPRLFVPWHIGAEAWAAYAKKYGKNQSAERIADRGGFGEDEMNMFRPGWRAFIVGGERGSLTTTQTEGDKP
jgi:hypothetical protein